MHDVQMQQRFVQHRSQGWSFARIAAELNVSKQTLINWSRKFQFQVQNLRAIELEALQDQLIASREARARVLAEQLRRVEAELAKRDLAKVATGRLFTLADALRRQVQRETGLVQFTSPTREIPNDEYCDRVQTWAP